MILVYNALNVNIYILNLHNITHTYTSNVFIFTCILIIIFCLDVRVARRDGFPGNTTYNKKVTWALSSHAEIYLKTPDTPGYRFPKGKTW